MRSVPTILNLYSGIGGNRKLWKGKITTIENNAEIAAIYELQYPKDTMIFGDATDYRDIVNHYDFVWISPPCKTHSKNNRYSKNYRWIEPDLIQWILWMRYNCTVPWVIENVQPYYEKYVDLKPDFNIGRHYFWSNFKCYFEFEEPNFIGKVTGEVGKLQQYLGINYTDKREYLRNAIHPKVGLAILNAAFTKEVLLFE